MIEILAVLGIPLAGGMVLALMGERDEATEALERTVRIGISSKMFDCQSLVLLTFLHTDKRDAKAFARAIGHLERAVEKRPESTRLRRLLETARILQALIERQTAAAVQAARHLARQARDEDFDFEAAANLIAALARLAGTEIQLPDGETWVGEVAARFCASKASTDMLALAAAPHAPYEEAVRAAHQTISTAAEKAMTHSLNGEPAATVRALLDLGGQTLNAKLLDMAGLVLNRHGAKIPDGASMGEQITGLRQRYCTRGTQVALGTSAGRSAGGLTASRRGGVLFSDRPVRDAREAIDTQGAESIPFVVRFARTEGCPSCPCFDAGSPRSRSPRFAPAGPSTDWRSGRAPTPRSRRRRSWKSCWERSISTGSTSSTSPGR